MFFTPIVREKYRIDDIAHLKRIYDQYMCPVVRQRYKGYSRRKFKNYDNNIIKLVNIHHIFWDVHIIVETT